MNRAANPTHLYKFRPLDSASIERVVKTLERNEIYLANPRQFNDPFDCKPLLQIRGTSKEVLKYFQDLFSSHVPGLTRMQRRSRAKAFMRNYVKNPKEMMAEFSDTFLNKQMDKRGIYALSACRDHILLWSHYADSHKGICLQFNAGKSESFFRQAMRVKYSEQFPVVDMVGRDPIKMLEATLLTKSSVWSYEQEWRIVDDKKGPGPQEFPPELLTGVILGAEMEDGPKSQIIDIVARREPRPTLYQAVLSKESYKLLFEEIEITNS